MNGHGKRITSIAAAGVIIILDVLPVWAAEGTGEYLKYQEPQYGSPSGFSVFSYMLSLLFTFALVVALAYFVSRFWGNKLSLIGKKQPSQIITALSLGTNKGIYVVKIAGEYFVVGVTDHQISLLKTITDPQQIEELNQQEPIEPESFQKVLRQQLDSLQHMSGRFPGVFGSLRADKNHPSSDDSAKDGEKREAP